MTTQQLRTSHAVIRVVGVGGGGSNAVNRMIDEGVSGVDFISINTDAQALRRSKAPTVICIGERSNRGLGAGGDPSVGERAAEETNDMLYDLLQGADMVFIAAGMGGGTGTGAAPVVANIAKDLGILTVAIVTKPFKFEGRRRIEQAERGIEQLRQYVDALVIVPNDRLQSIATNKLSLEAAFEIADNTLRDGIRGISDLITKTGVVNVDFADVRSILAGAGEAIMSIGSGTGENRMQHALQAAKHSMLLDVELTGANRVLINITSGPDITMSEIQEAVEDIEAIIDEEANIIWGSVIDPAFPEGKVQITLVATGTKVPRRDMRVNDARKRGRDGQVETGMWSQPAAPERPVIERPVINRPRDTGYTRAPQSSSQDERSARSQPRNDVDMEEANSPLQSSQRVGTKIQRPYEGRSDISIPPRMRGNNDRNP